MDTVAYNGDAMGIQYNGTMFFWIQRLRARHPCWLMMIWGMTKKLIVGRCPHDIQMDRKLLGCYPVIAFPKTIPINHCQASLLLFVTFLFNTSSINGQLFIDMSKTNLPVME